MTFPFLKDKENREVVHRIERDCEAEEKRYLAKKGEIANDFIDRDLYNSTDYVGEWYGEEVYHLRQVITIARNAIFEIIEGRDIKLNESDVSAITAQLHERFKDVAKRVQQELGALEKRIGLPPTTSQRQAVEMRIKQAIQRETVTEVSIRAAELGRKQERDSKLKRWERIEKLLWMVGGAVFGVLGTLVMQWITQDNSKG